LGEGGSQHAKTCRDPHPNSRRIGSFRKSVSHDKRGTIAYPCAGGVGVAWAGIEALTRGLAAELGPLGIRAVCLRSNAIPETTVIREAYNYRAKATSQTREEVQGAEEATTLLRRLPTLTDLANVATFMASDQARAMTATVANLSCGLLAD
jgi:NAD(P)-dependent dehydrogenase (short-subunit alcohol dehydrogenase family)